MSFLEIEECVTESNINTDDFIMVPELIIEGEVSISFFDTIIDTVPVFGSINKIRRGYNNGNKTRMLISTGMLGWDIVSVGTSNIVLGTVFAYEWYSIFRRYV